MKKSKSKNKKAKLSRDDLKKKEQAHDESLESLAGGPSASARRYDGDKKPD